jgi:hypothetical protein
MGITGSLVELRQQQGGVGGDGRQVQVTSDGERFSRPPDGLVVARAVGVGSSVDVEDMGPKGARRLVGHQPCRLGREAEQIHRCVQELSGRDQRQDQPNPIARRGGVGQRVELVLGERHGSERVSGGCRSIARPDHQSGVVDLIGVGSPIGVDFGSDVRISQELEGRLVVVYGLFRSADRHRVVAGLDARPGGRDQVVRGERMPGQLRRGARDLV